MVLFHSNKGGASHTDMTRWNVCRIALKVTDDFLSQKFTSVVSGKAPGQGRLETLDM